MDALDQAVAGAMRTAAARFILPRFQKLSTGHVREKSPGETVTIADHESEAFLTDALLRLIPGSHVVGEEAVAADPDVLGHLGEGSCWLVDPLDGTSNFAEGRTPFAVMVALMDGGDTAASWMLDPVSNRLCRARRGDGAFIDNERVHARSSGTAQPVGALATGFLPPDLRGHIEARAQGRMTIAPIPRCAGEQYPRLVTGENDVALFWRTLPWDHAPGALFLSEAGGRIARFDGSPYRPSQSGQSLLAAASPQLWDEARNILML